MKSKVYFIKEITPENIVKMYNQLGINLPGKIAIKLHSGEKGNQNYLTWDFYKPIISKLNATVVETNTAYLGARHCTEDHLKLMKEHGWDHYNFDIMDSEGDIEFDVPKDSAIKTNYVGSHLLNYDSMLVVSHFKGHPLGGFGGAIKQLGIGCASAKGKANIHSGGNAFTRDDCWKNMAPQLKFLEGMAEAASSIHKHFKGKIAYISVLKNISVDCDCCAVAEDPCMKDIGICASLDPVAIDQACIDLILKSDDHGKEHFMERVNSRSGLHTIERALQLDMGTNEYELIEIK